MPIIQTTPRTVPVGGYQAAATSPVGANPYDHHEHHHDHDYDMAGGSGSNSGMYAAMQHGDDHSGHGGMDHGGMDHGGHGGMDHGGMNHGGMKHGSDSSMCAMSMIWNTDPTNVCIVFPWWRITSSRSSLYSSLFLLVLIGVGYEWLRLQLRRLDRKLLASQAAGKRGKRRVGRRGGDVVGSAPSTPRRMQSQQQQQQQQHRRVASVNSSSKGLLVSSLQDADDNAGGGSSIRRTATPHLSDASGNESPDTPPYLAGKRHPTARKYTAIGGGQAGASTAASVPLSAMFSM